MSANELMLTDRLKSCTWLPVLRQNDITTRGGETTSIEYGPGYWRVSFVYENLQPIQWRLLTAWIARRNGSQVPFTAFMPSRRYPENHPSANNTGLTLSGYNSTTGAITINKGNMVPGDMVSWIASDNSQFVGEIKQVDTVSGSSTTFRTFPFARAPSGTPTPRIFEAVGRFRIVAGSIQPDDRNEKLYSMRFDARQDEKI